MACGDHCVVFDCANYKEKKIVLPRASWNWGGGGGVGFGYQRQSNSIVEGIYSTDSVYKTFEGFPKIKEKYLPAKYTHSCTRVLHNI